jgi:hypothetical protein
MGHEEKLGRVAAKLDDISETLEEITVFRSTRTMSGPGVTIIRKVSETMTATWLSMCTPGRV